MADNKEKQATCPICGAVETAMDADALESAMEEHMRLAHNQVASATPANTDLKETGRTDDRPVVPVAAPTVAGNVAAPGNNVGNDRGTL